MTWFHPNRGASLPWRIEAAPEKPGGGYLLKGENGAKVRVYGTREDIERIIEGVNNDVLVEALKAIYREAAPDYLSPRSIAIAAIARTALWSMVMSKPTAKEARGEARISELEAENARLGGALETLLDRPHEQHCAWRDPGPDQCNCWLKEARAALEPLK